MAVYVDPLFEAIPRNAQVKRCGAKWCHMIADTEEELHEMAKKIGLKRNWFQKKSFPHYDLVPSKRELAIGNGVIVCERKKFFIIMRNFKKKINLYNKEGVINENI